VKEPDRQTPYAPPEMPAHEPRGMLDEARNLIETMKDEAERRSELEAEAARTRGPVARVLLALTVVAAVVAVATLAYGVFAFPDAPIRATGGGYAGKGGTPRTREDFEAFMAWKTAALAVVPTLFALGFAFAVADARRRR
jgi:hypothetical protein